MDKRIVENIRVKNRIAEAFLELLENCSIDDAEAITISEITSKAEVSRMAYYRNFKSKSDIVDYFLTETLWKELSENLSLNFKFWSIEYGIKFFSLMKMRRKMLMLLKKHGYTDAILSAFNRSNEDMIGDMPQNSIERFNLYYAAGASYNALMHWLEGGCKESPEDMAKNFAKFCNFLNYPDQSSYSIT